jgi:protein TonB
MLKVRVDKGRVADLLTFYDDKGKAQPFNTKEADDILRPWFYPNTDVHWEKFEHAEQISNEQEEFTVVEVMPEFPGGQAEMAKFLQKNIHYPDMAKEAGIQGKVYISFVVRKDGSVSDVKIIRGVDPSLDKEAMRVVMMMPNWKPGTQNGRPVNVRLNLPINFSLK